MTKLKFKSSIKSSFYRFFNNLSAKFYQENKDYKKKKTWKRYQNLSKEEKEKKQQYGHQRCKKFLRRWKTKACWV